jgi:hypothetical protein
VLAGVLLVKAGTIGLAVLGMMWFMARAGFAVSVPMAVFFAAITVSSVAFAWQLLWAVGPARPNLLPHGHRPEAAA